MADKGDKPLLAEPNEEEARSGMKPRTCTDIFCLFVFITFGVGAGFGTYNSVIGHICWSSIFLMTAQHFHAHTVMQLFPIRGPTAMNRISM